MKIPGESLLKRTNQAWKLRAMHLGLAVSGCELIVGQWIAERLAGNDSVLVALSGVVLGLGAIAFACLTIRCSACGSRWLWCAVTTQPSGNWLAWLHSQQSCPTCGAHNLGAA